MISNGRYLCMYIYALKRVAVLKKFKDFNLMTSW